MKAVARISILSFVMIVALSLRAEAFFIPNAIQLISASLSNIIAYIIVIASVFFISAFGFIKTKMMNKKFILSVLGIVAILFTSVLVISEFSSMWQQNTFERGMSQPSLFRPAFHAVGAEGNEVHVTFSFFDDYESEDPSHTDDFSYSESELNETMIESYLMRYLEHSLNSEKICVEGEINGIRIDTCSGNCVEEIGMGNCFDIYVLEMFDLMSDGRYSTGIDLNSMDMEELSEYRLFSHIPQNIISRFTEIRLEDNMYLSSLEDIAEFNDSLAQYQDDKMIFVCYWGHSSNVLASIARTLGYDAYSAGFNDIEDDGLINVGDLQEANVDNAVMINRHSRRNRFRETIYITIDGLTDGSRYRDGIDVVQGTVENGTLKFPDLDISEVPNKNIVCSTRLACSLVQYWLSAENLTEEVDQIYLY